MFNRYKKPVAVVVVITILQGYFITSETLSEASFFEQFLYIGGGLVSFIASVWIYLLNYEDNQ